MSLKLDLNEIEKRIEQGYIRRQWTADKSLMIVNYTMRCAVERAWDDITLLTRGLILNADGTIHSRSFKKFFNLGEPPGPSIHELPAEEPLITVKEDGFLGISYWHDGKIKVASRGSFTSEYAVWATQWLRDRLPAHILQFEDACGASNDTFVFEILYPHRRIVVDNSDRYGLVLLAVIDNTTGLPIPRERLEWLAESNNLPIVEQVNFRDIEHCTEIASEADGTESEGYIAYYPKADVRVKIKGADYRRIHRMVTRLTAHTIWEVYAWDDVLNRIKPRPAREAAAKMEELKKLLPDTYRDWCDAKEVEFLTATNAILAQISDAVVHARMKYLTGGQKTITAELRKDIVIFLQTYHEPVWREALYVLDGAPNRAVALVWKRIEPGHELPLARDGEDE